MNIKERIQTVLQKLKLLDKAKANQLTDEEWKQIVDSYQKEYQSTRERVQHIFDILLWFSSTHVVVLLILEV